MNQSKRITRHVPMAVLALSLTWRAALAMDYRIPVFGVDIQEGLGRVSSDPSGMTSDPLNSTPPLIRNVLFLDSSRMIAFVESYAPDTQPAILVSDLRHRQISSVNLPELAEWAPRYGLLAGFRVGRSDNPLSAIALQAQGDLSAPGMTNRATSLVLLVFDGNGLVSRTQAVAIERQDFASTHGMPNRDYYYWTTDSIESHARTPGYSRYARILVADANADGFADVVVWEKSFVSRRIDEVPKVECDFADQYMKAQGDRLTVMLFDPTERKFSTPTPVEKLQKPPDALWGKVENVMRRR